MYGFYNGSTVKKKKGGSFTGRAYLSLYGVFEISTESTCVR